MNSVKFDSLKELRSISGTRIACIIHIVKTAAMQIVWRCVKSMQITSCDVTQTIKACSNEYSKWNMKQKLIRVKLTKNENNAEMKDGSWFVDFRPIIDDDTADWPRYKYNVTCNHNVTIEVVIHIKGSRLLITKIVSSRSSYQRFGFMHYSCIFIHLYIVPF